MFLTFLCFGLAVLQSEVGPKHGTEVQPSVPEFKKVVLCLKYVC